MWLSIAVIGTIGCSREPVRASTEQPTTASSTGSETAVQVVPTTVHPAEPRPAVQPLLVELFTSQGCHSCPPADRLLSKLGEDGVSDLKRPIIPLSFHVDYWNYLGWSDPFSSPRWTERQHRYAARVAAGRVYTPQLVIHGRTHAVGSRVRQVASALRAVAEISSEPAQLEVTAERSGRVLQVAASASRQADQSAAGAWIAVFENGVQTAVPRGENAGRTLRNDYIVRALEPVFELARGVEMGSGAVEIRLDKSWQADQVGVVAFLQEPETLHITGVSALAPMRVDAAR
ncbi:MAG: DUF1223 domain-containing protein [Myxococcota bacterium]